MKRCHNRGHISVVKLRRPTSRPHDPSGTGRGSLLEPVSERLPAERCLILGAATCCVLRRPGVNQELMLRLRSQIAMHSNKREALHRGPHTLRPYKLQLLPYFLRHRIAIASANDTFLNESNPAITYSCNHTAVMHLCIDKCAAHPPTPHRLPPCALSCVFAA